MILISLTFLAPWIAIAGVAGISIPILIHLLSRRNRPPVKWAAMRFILEAWQARRRRLRLQQILLLVIRCLIPVILGLALAQPLLSSTGLLGNQGRTIHLIIDNSMASMSPDTSGNTALERHKSYAISEIEKLETGDEVNLIPLVVTTNNQLIPNQRQHDLAIKNIRKMTVGLGKPDLAQSLEEAASRINMDPTRAHQVILISDFREGIGRVDEGLPPDLFDSSQVQLDFTSPATDSIEQVRIIDVQPLRRVVLREGGVQDLATQSLVRLTRDGEDLPATITRLSATSDTGTSTSRKVDWMSGQRDIMVDLALPVDMRNQGGLITPIKVEAGVMTPAQERHVLVEMEDVLRVIILDRDQLGRDSIPFEEDAGGWMERALKPVDELPIEIRRLDPLAMVDSDVVDADAIFILRPDLVQPSGWELLRDFRLSGGLLVFTPPGERLIHPWMDELNSSLNLLWEFESEQVVLDPPEMLRVPEGEDSILRVVGSELDELVEPVEVRRLLRVDPGLNGVVSIQTESGMPVLITESAPGVGTVAMLTTSPRLDWTSLPAKPLMVPLIQETLRGGLHLSRGRQQVIVGDSRWIQNMKLDRGEIRHPDGTSVILDPADESAVVDRPGTWTLLDDNGTRRSWIVANVDPLGGDLDLQSMEAVEQWLGETGQWSRTTRTVSEAGPGRSLVWILLGFLLFLLLLEGLLSRLFSPGEPYNHQHESGVMA